MLLSYLFHDVLRNACILYRTLFRSRSKSCAQIRPSFFYIKAHLLGKRQKQWQKMAGAGLRRATCDQG
eukprot:scaffold12887_cov136-Skeletonema_dohrnii-CCMP3373.AAC.1